MSVFSENFKEQLKLNKISQRDLAKHLNVTPSTLNGWVNGTRQPDFDMVKKIAIYLNVTTDFLLGHEKKEPAELTTDSVMYELKKRGLYDKLNSMSDDDRQAVLATLDTLCEQLSKNRK